MAADIGEKIEEWRPSLAADVTRVELAFFGGSFTCLEESYQRELLAAAAAAFTKDLIQGIRLSTRPDCINDRVLAMLKEYHVDTIELGAQSFNDSVLDDARRGHSAEDIRKAAIKIKHYGLNLVLQLMPCLPGERDEAAIYSVRQALQLNPSALRIYPTVVLEGTELAHRYRKGTFTPCNQEEAVALSARLYGMAEERGIPVIRTGLHPLSPEESKSVLAGPYHSALGFLVRARYRRHQLENLLKEETTHGATLHLEVPWRQLGEYLGHRRENILWLEKKFALSRLVVSAGHVSEPVIHGS